MDQFALSKQLIFKSVYILDDVHFQKSIFFEVTLFNSVNYSMDFSRSKSKSYLSLVLVSKYNKTIKFLPLSVSN